MSKYTLSINIQSESKDFLENLLVTLETINGDIEHIDSVEMITLSGPGFIDYTGQLEPTVYVGPIEHPSNEIEENISMLNDIKSKQNKSFTKTEERASPSVAQRNLFLDKWVLI